MSIMTRRFDHSREPLSDYVPGGRPLTGWKVLAIFVGLFAIVGAVNGVMIYSAVKTFRGEVTAHPYERGLAYNRDIAHAREQAVRDWRVDVKLTRVAPGETLVAIEAHQHDGSIVTGAMITATFAAPADLSKDVSAALMEVAPGRYEAKVALPAGQRELTLVATEGGREVFRSNNRVTIE